MTTLVRVRNLVKYFPVAGSKKRLQAVKDVSFEIAEGETLGLVGESGSGKTTVGRCLLRLEQLTRGEIWYRDVELSALSQSEFGPYRAKMQIVFQEPFDSLSPSMSIRAALEEPLRLHSGMSRRERKERLAEIARLVGLRGDQLDWRPHELSSGEQKRACIARAIATNPEFIVLDEPVSSLAPMSRVEVLDLLVRLQRELGLSYLYISHDLSTVKNICHRVAVMYLSQIVERGTKDQVFNNPKHPYSRGLLSSVLFPDPTHRRIDTEMVYALKGEIPSPIDLPPGCYLASRCPIALPVCSDMPQALRELEDGHLVRCWRVMPSGELKPEPEAQDLR
jgi:oligopeptide/dipeptide ABC transporter ATP-binding protein